MWNEREARHEQVGIRRSSPSPDERPSGSAGSHRAPPTEALRFISFRKKPAPMEKGKWAKVAEEFSRKAPLLGMSEEFLDLTRRFRKNFALKSPFDTKK